MAGAFLGALVFRAIRRPMMRNAAWPASKPRPGGRSGQASDLSRFSERRTEMVSRPRLLLARFCHKAKLVATRMTLSGPTVLWLSRAINVQAEASRSQRIAPVHSGPERADCETVHHRAFFTCSKVGLTPLDAEF